MSAAVVPAEGRTLKVALLGCGIVGTEVARIILDQTEELEARVGARLELAREPLVWWNLASASGALFGLVLAFNVLGDALRDAIDPRLRS